MRDFLDVRDVADIYYKLLMNGKSGEVYNVCSGRGIKLWDIIKRTAEILGIDVCINVDKARIRAADTSVIVGDNSKIKREFGWEPKFSFDETLNDMVNYWKAALEGLMVKEEVNA